MARMFNRLGGWWQLWMMLAVIWTIVAITSGWMNLPRAQHMPHDPQFLSKLSNEASSILHGTYAKAKPARGALVWSENPKIVRMWNDTRLTFPATTTDERAAFVASEYRQLLNVEADKQRGPYLLEMLAIWLAPAVFLLVAGMAVSSICRGYWRNIPHYVRQRREKAPGEADNCPNDGAPAIPVTLCHANAVATAADSQSTIRT